MAIAAMLIGFVGLRARVSHAELATACQMPQRLEEKDGNFVMVFNKNFDRERQWKRTCGAALEMFCNQGLRGEIEVADAHALMLEMVKDPELRMSNPRAACAPRAKLAQAWLAKRGIQSHIIIVRAPTILAVHNNQVYNYAVHVTVAIFVKTNGRPQRLILDPQFQNSPLSTSAYLQALTGGRCRYLPEEPMDSAVSECVYFRANSFPNDDMDLRNARQNPSEACRWNTTPALQKISANPLEKPWAAISGATTLDHVRVTALKWSRKELLAAIADWKQRGESIQPKGSLISQYAEYEAEKAEAALKRFDTYVHELNLSDAVKLSDQ